MKGKVRSSGCGGGGGLEGVGNNEANQLSRGEIFFTFFCIPLHASFQGGIFLLSFFAFQKTNSSHQSKDLCPLSD